jgi:hypothetical protein
MKSQSMTPEEIARRGQDIYDHEIRDKVESAHRGEFLVVDVLTGAYEIARDDLTASDRALEKNPKAVLYGVKIGSAAAYRLGGHVEVQAR